MAKLPWEIGDEISPGVVFKGIDWKRQLIKLEVDNYWKGLKLRFRAWIIRKLWERGWRP